MDLNIECKLIDFFSLKKNEQKKYIPFIFSPVLFLLNNPPEPTVELVAIEASLNNIPVGLVLAEFDTTLNKATMQSLFVAEEHRKRGMGTFLFQSLQKYLKAKKCRALEFRYESTLPAAPALEKILQKCHWNPPRFHFIRVHFDLASFHAPWYHKILLSPKPKGLVFFHWKNLKIEEKKRIDYEADQGLFPPPISPDLYKKEMIEPINSFGLRYKNKVIGWCLTHKTDPTTIRYSILYIQKEFRHKGWGIRLLAEAIKSHQKHAHKIPKGFFEVNYDQTERSFWTFVNLKLIPYAEKVEKIKHALQTL